MLMKVTGFCVHLRIVTSSMAKIQWIFERAGAIARSVLNSKINCIVLDYARTDKLPFKQAIAIKNFINFVG